MGDLAVTALQDPKPSSSGIFNRLPFDIIHALIEYTTPRDLVNLCSTCKSLRVLVQDESVWRRHCASTGLKDIIHFGGVSAYSIYTQLLYPYAPILGLWASDYPYRGNILEFSIFPGNDREQGGIIGEVWSFPSSANDPSLPIFVRVLKISFESVFDDTPPLAYARVFCHSGPSSSSNATPDVRHLSSLLLLPPNQPLHHIQFYRTKVDLPTFPRGQDPWYDDTSRYPRIRQAVEDKVDQSNIINIYPAARLPTIWVSPSPSGKHPAISIRCPDPRCACASLHVPTIPFTNIDTRPPRYYPLRPPLSPHGAAAADPRTSAWTLDSLCGLWYGGYGPHGTEVLYLHRAGNNVVATKITGDPHVPRGWMSWSLSEPAEEAQALMTRQYWVRVRPTVPDPARVFIGTGVMAARGFVSSNATPVLAALVRRDEIQVFWMTLYDGITYQRCLGR